jgi:3-deoxy-D-manno-octulosonic-acid transferase
MLILYSLALLLVLVVGAPFWLFRMATSGKYREGLGERLGLVPGRLRQRDSMPVVWVHAVSVGEVLAASRLIDQLRERAEGYRVVVSTTTRTGQRLARERFGAERVFYFPLDFAFAVRAYLRALQPTMLVLMETEFWPRMLVECRRAGIAVAVVNARISDRSWPRYLRLRFLWRRLLRGTALVLAQSTLDAERLEAIGAKNVRVGGNLKYDIRVARPAAVTEALRQHIGDAKLFVCGSTLEGEEEMLLGAVPADCIAVLAPRHPERFEAVAQLLERKGVRWVRRSEWMLAPAALEPGMVFLLDSIGELASVYSLASLAFVGGSLATAGGHNPLEPAQFGVPVVMGPHYENFRAIVEQLREVDGIRILDEKDLRAGIAGLFAHPDESRGVGERAHAIFASEAGATERAVQALMQLLESKA